MVAGRKSFDSRRGRHPQRRPIHVEPLEGRQLPAVFFDTFPTLVSEHAPSAAIKLGRFGDLDMAEQVHLATSDGTALAGVDYTAIDRVVTFGPGETTRTIPLTILTDDLPEAEETVNLILDDPSSSASERQVLTIADREDVPPPTVQDQRLLVTPDGAVKGIALTFSEPMALGPVQDGRNFSLSATIVDRDGGATGDIIPRHHAPVYDPATRTATVTFDRPLKPSTYRDTKAGLVDSNMTLSNSYIFSVITPPSLDHQPPLADVSGNLLDGFGITFSAGRVLRLPNRVPIGGPFGGTTYDGTAVLRMTGGGSLGFITFLGSKDTYLQVNHPKPHRSILTGHLIGAKVNSFAHRPLSIVSPAPFINKLKDPPFEVSSSLAHQRAPI